MTTDESPRRGARHLILTLVIAAIIFFGGGFAIALALGMRPIDQVAFMFCLGVVYLLAATGYTVWRG